MSYTSDSIRTLSDLGTRVAKARRAAGATATAISQRSGRSRDILHRLERGDDVSVSSLLDILPAMGCQLELAPARAPTLAEVKRRFAEDED